MYVLRAQLEPRVLHTEVHLGILYCIIFDTQRVQNEGKCDFGFLPSLDYCDSILIYKEVLRLRPSVQGDPFFGRRDGPRDR